MSLNKRYMAMEGKQVYGAFCCDIRSRMVGVAIHQHTVPACRYAYTIRYSRVLSAKRLLHATVPCCSGLSRLSDQGRMVAIVMVVADDTNFANVPL